MATMNDWAAAAAVELSGETVQSVMVEIIEKHCPFQRGVAYMPAPLWHPIDQAPLRDGSYIVYAPSADPAHPLITSAWFNPASGWSLLPDVWLKALTHWMDPEPPTVQHEPKEPTNAEPV